MKLRIGLMALLAGLGGCAEFPALDRAVPEAEQTGPYPSLVPVETLLAQTGDTRIETGDQARLDARAAALRARAARLRAN